MKLFWLLVVVSCVINETKSKSLRNNDTDIIKNDITKSSLPSKPAVVSERRTIGLFPRLIHKVNKSSVSWKPVNDKGNVQKNRKPVMRKLEIKNDNHKSKDMLRMKPTTRRPLMTIRRFTIKPHQVHSEPARGRLVWARKGRIESHNFGNTHRETNENSSRINEEISSEDRVHTDTDSEEFVKEVEMTNNIAAGSQNLITTIFPRRNKTSLSTNRNEQHINSSENVAMSNKSPSLALSTNKQNDDNKTKENKLNITSQDQQLKLQDAGEGEVFLKDISINGDEVQKPAPNSKLGTIKEEATSKSDIKILDLRPKRSVNIIEEEIVATSFPKSKITSREFFINYDLKFKNINT
ncbi:hypothetical protein KGM_213258 [Danaus plexippus plexippus]|uniref:Uncharacterized protein n=1 Tax=Danaus plexippus plexippus TaxID=278856 RepID=A0A212FE06_DANPL|nr:uncharacterized protein LOC116774422 [Danaus plexippus plexippus]OWR51972.1 hypothetical protein KGM_213258 [Danaus plexippus plexippus]